MQALADRLAIDDLLAEYVRAMDFGEVDAVARVFTADGSVRDITGKLWDAAAGGPRGFATRWLVPPLARRGQHWIQRVRTETLSDDSYRILSYWSSIRWDHAVSKAPIMGVLGTYDDVCVRIGGRWLIKEKVIEPWRSVGQEAPPTR